MKAKLAIIGLVAAALVGGTVGLGMSLGRSFGEARAAGDRFLGLLGEGKVDAAYEATSTAFRQAESPQSFRDIVALTGLGEFVSSSWSGQRVQTTIGGRGAITLARLEGTVLLRRETLHLTMELIEEDGGWKVFNFSVKSEL